jgi:RNA polymerase sigma factor (sigma-70 family)
LGFFSYLLQRYLFSLVINTENSTLGILVDFNSELISACKNNNRKAQIELYQLFARRMYNTSLRIVKNRILAEDVIQEAFISAFKSLEKYKGEVPFEAWLRKIVVNRSIDELRRERKMFFESIDEIVIADENLNDEKEIEAEKSVFILKLKEQLNDLADGYRIILSLYYLEGYDHEEISQILNISKSTSRSQLTRAIRKLKENENVMKLANELRQAT